MKGGDRMLEIKPIALAAVLALAGCGGVATTEEDGRCDLSIEAAFSAPADSFGKTICGEVLVTNEDARSHEGPLIRMYEPGTNLANRQTATTVLFADRRAAREMARRIAPSGAAMMYVRGQAHGDPSCFSGEVVCLPFPRHFFVDVSQHTLVGTPQPPTPE